MNLKKVIGRSGRIAAICGYLLGPEDTLPSHVPARQRKPMSLPPHRPHPLWAQLKFWFWWGVAVGLPLLLFGNRG